MLKIIMLFTFACLLIGTAGCSSDSAPNTSQNSTAKKTSAAPIITTIATIPPGDTEVNFPNANLQREIRVAISKKTGYILQSDILKLTQFDARAMKINDLTGLEHCTNLKYLMLRDNQISDISLLASLTKLESLYLIGNKISDINVLASLTNLKKLDISNNQITDISPLTSLINLQQLAMSDNQIADISPLMVNYGLIQRVTVDIRNNPLNTDSLNRYIPQLQKRKITILFTPPPTP
jgi:hypothetical protein